MYNSDYIPIDQEVIGQEAREILRDACKNAGGNYDIIAFRSDRKRIVRALENIRIFWCEVDGEILVSRHELYDAIFPRE